jgi:hypothetical protein
MKTLAQNQSNVEQIRRDVVGIARKRSKMALRLAERLKPLATASGNEKAIYDAAKLALCGSQRNIWTASDMQNSDGEAFDGVGALWACSLPYCENCLAVKATRHRRRIRNTLGHLKPRVGLKWRFITLTSPSVSRSPLQAIKVYKTAWASFVRRVYWKRRVWAGYRGIEFTVNKISGLVHCHIHALALSQQFDYDKLRGLWTDCITKAWSDNGVSLQFKTSDEKAVVKVINELQTKHGHKGLDDAILETAKYCADGAAWASLSDIELLEIVALDTFPRLFETFGETRKFDDDIILDNPDLKLQILKTTKPRHKRDITTLKLRVNVSRSYQKNNLKRRFPVAQFQTLDGIDFLPSEPQPSEPQRTKLRLIKGSKIK